MRHPSSFPRPYPTCCHQPGSIEQQEALQKRLSDSEQKLALRLTEVDDLRRQRNEYEEAIAVLDDTNARLQIQVGEACSGVYSSGAHGCWLLCRGRSPAL